MPLCTYYLLDVCTSKKKAFVLQNREQRTPKRVAYNVRMIVATLNNVLFPQHRTTSLFKIESETRHSPIKMEVLLINFPRTFISKKLSKKDQKMNVK